jgi:hypothetical protein
MLRLINIETTDDTIRAEYTPEDSEEIGMVELSRKSEDIIKSRKTSYDEPVESYLQQAATALRKILNEPKVPKTRLIMWY